MWLSILLGESEPWLLGAVVCTVTLLIVSLAILRSNKWQKDACPKSEEQKISTPPQRVDLPIDVNVEEVGKKQFVFNSVNCQWIVVICCNINR